MDGWGGRCLALCLVALWLMDGPRCAAQQGPTRTMRIRVVDEVGRPVAGASLTPYALRARGKPSAHYGWSVERHGEPTTLTTDRDGEVDAPYPQFVDGRLDTGTVSYIVAHPDYCRIVADYRVYGNVSPIVLPLGGRLKVRAVLAGGEGPPAGVQLMIDGGPALDLWDDAGDGWRLSRPLAAGTTLVRAVFIPESGPVLFSDAEPVRVVRGKTAERTLELHPGVRLEGVLDDIVPRPVRSGRVIAASIIRHSAPGPSAAHAQTLHWFDTAEVGADGRFVFESLPRDADPQLIAQCDGYVSCSPGGDSGSSSSLPQTILLEGHTVQAAVRMEAAAICEVKVVTEDGAPVAGARVAFSPNVRWAHGGSSLFADQTPTAERLGALRHASAPAKSGGRPSFAARTGADGVAVIRNLPTGQQRFSVSHDRYEIPPQPAGEIVLYRDVFPELPRGQTTRITITVRKKGTAPAGAN